MSTLKTNTPCRIKGFNMKTMKLETETHTNDHTPTPRDTNPPNSGRLHLTHNPPMITSQPSSHLPKSFYEMKQHSWHMLSPQQVTVREFTKWRSPWSITTGYRTTRLQTGEDFALLHYAILWARYQRHMATVQKMTLNHLSTYLHTTLLLEIGSCLTRQGDVTIS